MEPGKQDLDLDLAPNVTAEAATATQPGTGAGWSTWQAVLEVHHTGTYEVSLQQTGDTWLSVDGQTLIGSPGLHAKSKWSVTIPLTADRPYHLAVNWFAVIGQPLPALGLAEVSNEISAAVNAARSSQVALVFVSNTDEEGVDNPDLSLPGDAGALISAVAAANPRTVVVLNTGGPVLMPWIGKVAGVVEAWYPGQQDGTATAAVLDGRLDPGGHLPITFPAVGTPSAVGSPGQFPGINSTVHYTEGLDIGYRWYQQNGVKPLFPFGFGLSYTSFALTKPFLQASGGNTIVDVTVTNTGRRAGTTVVQAYLSYPAAAGEPPNQLRAFAAVDLKPSQSRTVRLTLTPSSFEAFLGTFQTVPGHYQINVGQSSAELPIHLAVTR